ncbi:MAG: 50S ribosomal protein L19 [Planctomycetota bacterium]
MIHPLIQAAEAGSAKTADDLPKFDVGADVDVFYKIVEGKKERVQRFTGTVIQIKGRGTTKTFTVRRLVAGQGVERIFPFHSPNVTDVKVKRVGKIRRARLYYLRDRVGKATRLTEKKDGRVTKKQAAAAEKAAAEAA